VLFLKERTKNCWLLGSAQAGRNHASGDESARAKVFWFFFSKKNTFFFSVHMLAAID
jgi:hypothetical protein